jgi:MFS family permease
LFFAGQSVSLIGTWMTRVATGWLVYRLTHSAALLGLVGFASQIPSFFLAPIAGVWVDRWNRHHALIVTQVLSMVQSLALAALAISGIITIWEILLLALAQGLINAFDMPVRQSFVVQMVDQREDLGNAIALNSSIVNVARLLGPAIAGFVIAAVGEGYCFLFDGVSYVAVVASLLAMHVNSQPRRNIAESRVKDELVDGWRYVIQSAPIRSILIMLSVVSLVAMPYTVLMPVFASAILHGNAQTLGFLTAAAGGGALIGAVALALRRSVLGLGRRIVVADVLFGASLVVFAFSHNFWLSLAILPFTGFGMMQQMASSNTILQTIVDDEKRGRVMAYYSMAFQGIGPFGSLAAGALAAKIGAPATLAFGGGACLLAALWFSRQSKAIRAGIRPIYVKLGILPKIKTEAEQIAME